MNEKAAAIPAYMKANSAFQKEMQLSPTFADRPLPPAPSMPRSARVVAGKGESSIMFSVPSSAPLSRAPSVADSLRSLDRASRRKVQVSPLPVQRSRQYAASPLGNGQGSRKRDLLPSLFRFGPKVPPPAQIQGRKHPRLPPGLAETTPDQLARKMQGKTKDRKKAAAAREERRRHKHSHSESASASSAGSLSTISSASSVDIDIDLKSANDMDITDFHQGGKVIPVANLNYF